jgi:hypothetical protein
MGGLSDLGSPEITPAAARVLNGAGFIFLATEIVVVVPLLIVHVAVWIWIVAAVVTLLVDMAILAHYVIRHPLPSAWDESGRLKRPS